MKATADIIMASTNYCCSCECRRYYRLQQPVQNPISENTYILWNSLSLGKNYSYRLLMVL